MSNTNRQIKLRKLHHLNYALLYFFMYNKNFHGAINLYVVSVCRSYLKFILPLNFILLLITSLIHLP